MKVVIPGGTGQVGTALGRALRGKGHQVVVLSRRAAGEGQILRDGERPGPWVREIDGCDVVINLAGRSVSCRYTKETLTEMMRSRVRSARVVGQAIAAARRPPRAWLQMSTATIYAHTHGAPNDEVTGVIGGSEAGVPGYWAFSVDIAQAWERELDDADVAATRKGSVASRDGDDPGQGRGVRSAVKDGTPGAGRPDRRRRAVRVVDPRGRLHRRGPLRHRPGQSDRAG